MSKKISLCILIAGLMGIGAWLRTKGTLEGSFSFTYDIGRDMLAVQNIVLNHNLTLIGPTTGFEGLFYGPWWYYLLGIPFLIARGDPKGVTLFIGFLGMLCIPLAFLIGKRMKSTFYGIACAALVTISVPFIQTSSQIWNPNVIPLFMLLVILCLQNIVGQKYVSAMTWVLLGFLVTLIIEMEVFFGLLFAISLLASLLIFLKKNIFSRKFFFSFAGIFFIELPRILFELRHSFLMSNKVLGAIDNSTGSFRASIFERKNFIEIQSRFDEIWSSTIANSHHEMSLLILGVILLILFLYFRKINLFERFILVLTIVTSFVFIVVFLFFSEGLWLHYLVGIPVLFVLSTGISLRLLQKHFSKSAAYVLLFGIAWFNLNPITRFAESKMPLWEGNEAVYRNQIQVIDYIYNEAGDKEFKYDLYTPPIHDYTYKYLFSWYGKGKYNKIPNNKEAQLFFLIVEPDLDYYHRRLDWLAKKAVDGKLIKKQHVVGNIVVHTKTIE